METLKLQVSELDSFHGHPKTWRPHEIGKENTKWTERRRNQKRTRELGIWLCGSARLTDREALGLVPALSKIKWNSSHKT